jgi:hypothetical protein
MYVRVLVRGARGVTVWARMSVCVHIYVGGRVRVCLQERECGFVKPVPTHDAI